MSEPKRYSLQICHTEAGVFHLLSSDDTKLLRDDDEFVRYEDYARLQAEVERLTKAGDAMAAVCGWDFYDDSKAVELINNWEASKEGRDNR